MDLFGQQAMVGQWPPRGLDVTLENVAERVWKVGDVQYAVMRRGSDDMIGLVSAHGIDEFNGTAALGFVIDPACWRSGWPFEAFVLFLNVLFEWHGFRKLYCEVADSTLTRFRSVERWLDHEATFREHVADGPGRYQDWHVLSLSRAAWDVDLVRTVTGVEPQGSPASRYPLTSGTARTRRSADGAV